MIAYNKEWLANELVQDEINTALGLKLVQPQEAENVNKAYPVLFYSPNIFIRIGLFVLTVIIAIFSIGLIALVSFDSMNENFASLGIFLGLCCWALLEMMVSSKHHYRSGVDDALLYMAVILLFSSIVYITEPGATGICITACVIATLAVLRFADRLLAVTAFVAFSGFFFFQCMYAGNMAQQIAPFLIFFLCLACYFISVKMIRQPALLFYSGCLKAINIASLFLMYLSVNYFAVQEIRQEFFYTTMHNRPELVEEVAQTPPLPLAWLFWIFTCVLPLVYIGAGIVKKDSILIRVGLVLCAAIVFTVRYYHSVLPLETAMVIGGLVLVGIAWFLINYLKNPRYGFTNEAENDTENLAKNQLESLVIATTFSGQQAPDADTHFGGGSAGGGGAGGTY